MGSVSSERQLMVVVRERGGEGGTCAKDAADLASLVSPLTEARHRTCWRAGVSKFPQSGAEERQVNFQRPL